MTKDRLEWVDITKCMAILLMIIGHSSIPDMLSNFIYAFHMPTFFILSGMCTNWQRDSVGIFIKRKIKSILLPFFIYSIIVMSISHLFDIQIFTVVNGWGGYALWFVPIFLLSVILSKLYFSVDNKNIRLLLIAIILSLAVFWGYSDTCLQWALSSVPYAIILVISGYYLKKIIHYITRPSIIYICISIGVVAVVSHYFRLDIAWNKVTPIMILTITAIVGTGMLINIATCIEKVSFRLSKWSAYVGRNTFIAVAFSQLIMLLINRYLYVNFIFRYLLLFIILFLIILLKNMIISLMGELSNTGKFK